MPVRVLHCHSTFSLGGKEARAVRLMNAFGSSARHMIVSGMPEALGARASIAPGIAYEIASNPPPLTGRPSIERYKAIARYMMGFDIVLSYNWGAMDAVMARRMFARDCPPLVHHEDGFNADEATKLKIERNLFRRLALPAASALAVPSKALERIALDVWKQPGERIHRIPNGIATAAYAKRPKPGAIPGLKRRPGEVVIGTVAGLRAVKNLPRLVRATLSIPGTRLVVVGDGPDGDAIRAAAAALDAGDRLVMPGFLANPASFLGLFDIFALSSDSEQFPISLVEAMAAGLPVAATDVGDIRAMLPGANRRFVTFCDDHALSAALRQLVADEGLRVSLGKENQGLATACYDERTMIEDYASLYNGVLGKNVQFEATGL